MHYRHRHRYLAAPLAALALGAAALTGPLTAGGAAAAATGARPGTARAARPGVTAVPAGFSPVSLTYASTSQGWVLGTVPCGTKRCTALLRTSDAGASWERVPAPPIAPEPADSPPMRVRFADADDGWVFSTLPGQTSVEAYSTHDGGARWSVIHFPVRGQYPPGIEDIEAAGGAAQAALQIGPSLRIFSSPVTRDAWVQTGGPFELGAGPIPTGEFALHGSAGWFVQDDRVVVSGARREASGRWASWQPPCAAPAARR